MSYKLTYFNFAGRAEPIRWILAAAGVRYVDDRIQASSWSSLKQGKFVIQIYFIIIMNLKQQSLH